MSTASVPPPMTPDEFEALDEILDELRTRDDETPVWELCEGFLAALVCCRRAIDPAEYLPVLLDVAPPGAAQPDADPDAEDDAPHGNHFASAEQAERFMALWTRRWHQVAAALDAPVESLADEGAYVPELVDLRGLALAMSEEERAQQVPDMAALPSFGQMWAIGFMYVVETWPEEWHPPRDRKLAHRLNESILSIVLMTEDDEDAPTVAPEVEGGAPSVSDRRLEDFADAIWAVYSLRELWRGVGPRVTQRVGNAKQGRNDLCACGSGKKYKKCCGAA